MTLRTEVPGAPRTRANVPLLASVAVAATVGAVVGFLPLGETGTIALAASLVLVGAVAYAGRERFPLALGLAVYVLALHWIYTDWIVPVYGYAGLVETGADWPSLLFVSTVALLPAAWLSVGLTRPSEIVLWVLYLLGYVPATVIPIHILGPDLSAVLPLEIALAAAFAILGVLQRIPRPRATWLRMSEQSFGRLLAILGSVLVVYIVIIFGLPTGLPGLESVYETRGQASVIERETPLAGYLVTWAGNVVFPLLLALGLARRRLRPLILGTGGQLLVYGVTGGKTALFSVVLVLLLYLAVRHGRGAFGTLLSWGGVAVLWLSVAATATTGSVWPLALFPTRVLAVTGQLTADYYQFFSTHATYQLSNSFLRWFNESPYDLDAARLVAGVYYGTTTTVANANIWADAMANFGLLGIVPFTIVLGIVLWVLDIAGTGRDLTVIGPVLGIVGFNLSQSALFTAILTSGIALTIVLVALMPPNRGGDQEPVSRRAGPASHRT